MCILHLFNTSIIHIFYRTQVLRIGQKLSKIFNKIFLYITCFIHLPFTSPKAFPKSFKIFLLNLPKLLILTPHFLMFETCNCQSFLAFRTPCFCVSRHLLKMNSHLNLDFFNTSSLLVQKPATVGSQLIDNTI